jgi:hypothetical protein
MTDRDPFEDRLRETLRSGDGAVDRPDVETFLSDVHRGARTRQRRRVIEVAAAAAVVVVGAGAAAGSLGLFQNDQPSIADQATATSDTSSPTETTTSTQGSGIGDTIHYTAANSTVLSVTSTDNDHQWALIETDDPRCGPYGCRSVVPYSAGNGWGAPGLLPVSTTSDPASHVRQLRFAADASGGYDGWAFDQSLLSIHGIGTTGFPEWHTVDVNGAVMSLEARGRTVYALVRRGGQSYLYSSPMNKDAFQQVDLGFELGAARNLVVTSGVVAFLDQTADGTEVVSIPADPSSGEATGDWTRSQPCESGSGPVQLSSASDTLWALCTDGSTDTVSFKSVQDGTWSHVTGYRSGWDPGSLLVARSTDAAVLHLADNTQLMAVTAAGAETLGTSEPPFTDPTMLGFTNPDLGFAIAHGVLWRTEDGGSTWSQEQVVSG